MSVAVSRNDGNPNPKPKPGNWWNGDVNPNGYRGRATQGWGPKPVWSPHAKDRRRQMGLTEHRVERAYHEPEIVYPSPEEYQGGRARECRQKGDVVVVVEGTMIITVLWHLKEGRDEEGEVEG